MKIFWKILKGGGLLIGSLLIIIILAGLSFRLFGPDPHQPLGELIDVEGIRLHLNRTGAKSNMPTLIIEGGAGSASEYYHWLSEGLKDSIRVVRYDRAGIGYSDGSNAPRDPETIARELHLLLEKAGEEPPYIMAGHSLGGPYVRVFTQLYPDEVLAMVLLDTTHPEQVERFDLPLESSTKFKMMIWLLDIQAVLGDLGIIALYDRLMGPFLAGEGLPDEINNRIPDFLLDGKYIRGYKKEMENYHATLERSGVAQAFGALPIRVFTATEINEEAYRAQGIDPEQRLDKRIKTQGEFTKLSTDSKQTLIDGSHSTIFTKKENADIICQEILLLLAELGY